MKQKLGLAVIAFGLLVPRIAGAQPTTGIVPDPTAAELFHTGRALVEKGDWDAGCPKFEASIALYLSASTMLNIAKCHEHYGRIATAWATYNRALTVNRETPGLERRKALEEIGKKGISALRPRLPMLRISIADMPSGTEVTRDGQKVPSSALGIDVPVDPGMHTITAGAPGFQEEQRTIKAEESKLTALEIKLIPLPKEELEKRKAERAAQTSEGVHIPAWTIGVGAGSLVLLTVAAAFRIDQSRIEGEQYGKCRGDVRLGCPADYDPSADNARKNRDFGLFLGFGGVGLLALGTAVAGAIVAKPPSPSNSSALSVAIQPWIGHRGAGAALGGHF